MAEERKNPVIAAVDLFCGVGGLTHGLLREGIVVRAGFDIDSRCQFPYEQNNQGAKFFDDDVKALTGETLKKFYKPGEVSILAGCAPCQPFSTFRHTYNKKLKKQESQGEIIADDDKWSLLRSFGRLVSEVKPDIVTMENVPKLVHHSVFDEFLDTLTENGLVPDFRTLDCSKFGIPQRRKRLVLLASMKGKIKFPDATEYASLDNSVKNAIGHLPRIAAGEENADDTLHRSRSLQPINLRRIQASRPGGTWKEWDKELLPQCYKVKSGESFQSVYGRMSWKEPAPTITTQFFGYGTGRFGHPEQDRALSLREGALLQTFPSNYEFIEEGADVTFDKLGQWIGNAVPVDLGRLISRAITKHVSEYDWD